MIFLRSFLETHYFSSHMHGYLVTLHSKKHVVKLCDLYDPLSVMLKKAWDGNTYVTSRKAAFVALMYLERLYLTIIIKSD